MRDQETDRHPSVNEGDHCEVVDSTKAGPEGLNHPSVNEGDHHHCRFDYCDQHRYVSITLQ